MIVKAPPALTKTVALFEKTFTGLFKGDADLGLLASTDKDILAQLEKIKGLWTEYKLVLANADVSEAGLKSATNENLPLLNSYYATK